MKFFQIIFIFSILTIISCNSSPKLEKMSDKEYVKRAVKNDFPSPDSIIIKDIVGNIMTKEEMIAEYEQGGLTTDFYKNKKGEVVEAVVRKSTPADQEIEAQINKKLNAAPPVTVSQIDCDNVIPLLDEAYRRDQEIRKEEGLYDATVDHKNLELVISVDQVCGLPKGVENEKQINIIWLVIQHSKAEYRKRYISYFVEANEAGAIDAGSIALMKDRMAMDDGKPQIYGSQLIGDNLYNLRDASTVDQRRASVGLEPLKEYLARFGVSFDVVQG
jgi:hypothetical protein